ncbi:hypothetical protein WJX79_005709 [Trebouxia sp. C0005]
MSSAFVRLAPLAPRLTATGLCRQQQRGFSAAVGHGDAKVNCWEQPTNISNWKEEHDCAMRALQVAGSFMYL